MSAGDQAVQVPHSAHPWPHEWVDAPKVPGAVWCAYCRCWGQYVTSVGVPSPHSRVWRWLLAPTLKRPVDYEKCEHGSVRPTAQRWCKQCGYLEDQAEMGPDARPLPLTEAAGITASRCWCGHTIGEHEPGGARCMSGLGACPKGCGKFAIVAPDHAARDTVNHPPHYTSHPSGIECIDVTRHMTFNIGNAVKYLWRAGLKSKDPIEDLKKAAWYIRDEIARLGAKP